MTRLLSQGELRVQISLSITVIDGCRPLEIRQLLGLDKDGDGCRSVNGLRAMPCRQERDDEKTRGQKCCGGQGPAHHDPSAFQ
jgi:hypothetical protein